MLQIIGWLGCAMLAVKLLEMGSNPAFKKEDGGALPGIGFALLFGWCAVVVFAIMLLRQGQEIQDAQAGLSLDARITQEEAKLREYEQRLRDAGVEVPEEP